MIGLGTLVNAAAVVAGGLIGLVARGGLKERFQETVTQALGLSVIFIGVSGALEGLLSVSDGKIVSGGAMAMVISLALGGLVGEWINLDALAARFGDYLRKKFAGRGDDTFVDGFVNASCTICVGAMAIVGSLEDGLTGDASTLFTKSILDGIILIVFASVYGRGAIFSVIPLVILQGGVTLLAGAIAPLLTDAMIQNLSYLGSALIFLVGVNMLFKMKIRVANFLPSLVFILLFALT